MSRRALLGGLVSAAFLFALLRSIDLNAVLAGLLDANPLLLVPALALYFCGVWLRSARWRYLLQPIQRVPTATLFRTMVIGFTVNNLMPVRLGEVARALLLARSHGIPVSATLGTILVERFFDGLALCAFLALGLGLLPEAVVRASWLVALAQVSSLVFLVAVLVAWLLAVWPEQLLGLAQVGLKLAPASARERINGVLRGFVSGLRSLGHSHLALRVLALSLAAWVFEASMYYLVMLGFHLDLPATAALLGTAAANLGTMIPSSPGYVGTFDLPLQGVLSGAFGIAPAQATSYTLVVHAALIIPVVVLGLVFLARADLSLRSLQFSVDSRQLTVHSRQSTVDS
ncbi:MAG: flippase-like domain-containing protein [Chloroflexi bacterium]|nr:flippase-like domain-containing protein [Chloroflexota bacterium]